MRQNAQLLVLERFIVTEAVVSLSITINTGKLQRSVILLISVSMDARGMTVILILIRGIYDMQQ